MKSKTNQVKLFILSILLIFSIIAIATINTSALIYDEINDSSINWNIWGSILSGDCSENTDKITCTRYLSGNFGGGWNSLYTTNLTDWSNLQNVTFKTSGSATGDCGTTSFKITLGGITKDYLEAEYVYDIVRNETTSSSDLFDIFRDGSKIDSINISSNGLTIQIYATKIGSTGCTVAITMSYLYYELNDISNINVTLGIPTNGNNLTSPSITFNGTITPTGQNLTNATLYIWDNNSVLNYTSTNTITGDSTNTTSWITSLLIGNYIWNIFACGNVNCNFAASNNTFNVNYSLENPIINIIYPTNNSYVAINLVNFTWNVSDSDNLTNSSVYVYNSSNQLVNQTTTSFSPGVFESIVGIPITLVDGIYTWFVDAFDTLGNSATSNNQTFTIDTVYPQINITYPLSGYNYSSLSTLNYTLTETNPSVCKFYNGTTNATITCGNNLTSLVPIQGGNTWTIYVNDSAGNSNSSSVTFVYDTIAPQITTISPYGNGTYLNNSIVNFTYTIIDPNNNKYEYYSGSIDTYFLSNPARTGGQTFTPGTVTAGPFILDKISMSFASDGSLSGNVNISIYATSGGFPVGSPLSQAVMSTVGISTYPTWTIRNITMPPITLQNGTMYAIVISETSAGELRWPTNGADPYAGGACIDNTGAWIYCSGLQQDNLFEVWGYNITSGIQNTTIYVYNATNGSLINQTTKQSYELSNIFNTIVGIPMILLDGVYSWFADVFDFAGNYNITSNQTFTVDTVYPQINITYPLNGNYYNINNPFANRINYTINEINPNTCWFTLNGGNNNFINCNQTYVGNCYQETANATSSSDGNCALIYTGTYSSSNSAWVYPPTLAYDGIWTSSAWTSGIDYIYINYTKPTSSNNNSLWRVSYGESNNPPSAVVDLSIPSSCWNYNSTKLSFRVSVQDAGSTGFACLNSSGWNTLLTTNSQYNAIFEEAMLWNIGGIVNAVQGNNTLTVYANDTAGNLNSSTISFFLDYITPIINLTYPTNGSYFNNSNLVFNYTININTITTTYNFTDDSVDYNQAASPYGIWFKPLKNLTLVSFGFTDNTVGFDYCTLILNRTLTSIVNGTAIGKTCYFPNGGYPINTNEYYGVALALSSSHSGFNQGRHHWPNFSAENPNTEIDIYGGLYATGSYWSPEYAGVYGPYLEWAFSITNITTANIANESSGLANSTLYVYQNYNDCFVGGNVTMDGDYCVNTFRTNDTLYVTKNVSAKVLVVGGGGGGAGGGYAGGGGAGGLIYNDSYSLSVSNINVIVGTGGAGGIGDTARDAYNGSDSSFGDLIAIGGGFGSKEASNGGNGGSGGGASYSGSPGTGVAGQGYAGGYGLNGCNGGGAVGGGGGGAGAIGGDGSASIAGPGGNGLNFTINGTNVYYAGGGGGGGDYRGCLGGIGGLGGGGNGTQVLEGGNGTDGLGGGGSGGSYRDTSYFGNGGKGGNGVVIVRYLKNSNVIIINQTTTTFAPNTFSAIIGIPMTLLDGIYNWFVDVFDIAGNQATSQSQQFGIDTLGPSFGGDGFGGATLNSGVNKSQTNVYMQLNVIEANIGNVTYLLSSTNNITNQSIITSNLSYNFTNVSNGHFYYNVQVCDIFGRCNTTGTRLITLDTISPTLSLSYPSRVSQTYINTNNINFNYTITDATSGAMNSTLYIYSRNTDSCYQETATENTSCGGISGGSYSSIAAWNDADWGTSVNGGGTYLMSYHKPTNLSNLSLSSIYWRVKFGSGYPPYTTDQNLTVPAECINANSTHINFKVVTIGDYPNRYRYAYCKNSTNGDILLSSEQTFDWATTYFYEEAIIWNSYPLLNQTLVTLPNLLTNTLSVPIYLTDGTYFWKTDAFDFADNFADPEENFTVDTLPPRIQIVYPLAQNYTTVVNHINISFEELNPNTCWYSLNGGTNTTYNCSLNITGLTANQGSNTWIVYANDSANNFNSSSVNFFVDSNAPNITLIYPPNNSYVNTSTINFTYIANDTYVNNSGYCQNLVPSSNDTRVNEPVLANLSSGTNWAYIWYLYNGLGKTYSARASNKNLFDLNIYNGNCNNQTATTQPFQTIANSTTLNNSVNIFRFYDIGYGQTNGSQLNNSGYILVEGANSRQIYSTDLTKVGTSLLVSTSSGESAYQTVQLSLSTTQDGVIDTWFYDDGQTVTGQILDIRMTKSSVNAGGGIRTATSTTNYYYTYGGGYYSSSVARTVGWRNLKIVSNSSGSFMYIDGQLLGSATGSTYNSSDGFLLRTYSDTGGTNLNGYHSRILITNPSYTINSYASQTNITASDPSTNTTSSGLANSTVYVTQQGVSTLTEFEYYNITNSLQGEDFKQGITTYQSFRIGTTGPNETFNLNTIAIKVGQALAIPNNYSFYVYNATNETNCLLSELVASNTSLILPALPGPTYYWINATLSGTLLQGKQYCLQVQSSEVGGAQINWVRDASGTYAGGMMYSGTGAVWDPNSDVLFEIYGTQNVDIIINQTTTTYSPGVFETVIGIPITLLDGIYNWFADVFDIAGNKATSQNQTVTVDTIPPVVSFIGSTPADGANVSQTSITVEVSVTETNEANITFKLINAFSQPLKTYFYNNATRSVTFTNLIDGPYSYNVQVCDLANQCTTIQRNVFIDNKNPNVQSISPTNGSYVNESSFYFTYAINDTYKRADLNVSGTPAMPSLNLTNYYPFDTNFKDYYGLMNFTTYSGTPTITTNGCLKGIGCYNKTTGNNIISQTTGNTFNLGDGDKTFNLWVKPASYPVSQTMILGQQSAYYISVNTSLGIYWAMGPNTWLGSLPVDQWTMITYIRNNSYGGVLVYLNGVFIGSSDSTQPPSSNDQLYLGLYPGNDLYNGYYDEFRVYDRILSPTEILQLYNGEIVSYTTNESILLNITYLPGMQPNFDDLKFYPVPCNEVNDSITPKMVHGFNSINPGVNAMVWMIVPNMSSGNNQFCMEYGQQLNNNGATNQISNCYQETANVSTSCGGLSTGTYAFDGTWTSKENTYDGNWSTSGICSGVGVCNIYINYTIPANATGATSYYSGAGGSQFTYNLSASNCFNTTLGKVLIKGTSDAFATQLSWACSPNGGVSYTTFYTSGVTGVMYEEAINWSILTYPTVTTVTNFVTGTPQNLNGSGIQNSTLFIYNQTSFVGQATTTTFADIFNALVSIPISLTDAVYHYFFNAYDFSGNLRTSSNVTFTVDTLKPGIQFTSPTLPSGSSTPDILRVNVTIVDINYNYTIINVYNESESYITSSQSTNNPFYTTFTLPNGIYFYNATTYDLATNANSTETRNITIDVPPSVVFVNQTPPDISSLNLFGGTGLRVNYNILANPSSSLNLSSILMYYQTNSSTSNYLFVLNGTVYGGWNNISYNLRTDNLTLFRLFDNNIYPAVYNLPERPVELSPHSITVLNGTNDWVIVQLLGVSNKTYYNQFEIMANSTSNLSGAAQIYYCNSTYASGDPGNASDCALVYSLPAGTPYNHCHSEFSCHQLIPVAMNNNTGTIGSVKVTSDSRFVFGGATGTWNVYSVANISRPTAAQLSNDNGGTWNNQTFTWDSHLHQYDGSDTFWYYVTASTIYGNSNTSATRMDLIDLGGLPPSAPQVLSPTGGYKKGNISIVYTASVSPNAYEIVSYNGSLLNSNDQSFNRSIFFNNGTTLSYLLDSTTVQDGHYIVRVQATDALNQTSFGLSDPIIIDNTYPQIAFGTLTTQSGYYSSSIIVYNISASDTNLRLFDFVLYNISTRYRNITVRNSSPLNYFGLFAIIPNGIYNMNGSACDYADNCNYTDTRHIILDTVYPVINFTQPYLPSGFYALNALWTNVTVYDLSLANITLILNGSLPLGGSYYNVQILTGINSTTGASFFYNWTGLSQGLYNLSSYAYDYAGHRSDNPILSYNLDADPPVITYNPPTYASGITIVNNSFPVNVSADDPNWANMTLNIYDSGHNLINTFFTTTKNININTGNLTDDTYTYTTYARDTANNLATATRNITLEYTRVSITTCRQLLTPYANYVVENDLSTNNGTCLDVVVPGANINCQGHSIIGREAIKVTKVGATLNNCIVIAGNSTSNALTVRGNSPASIVIYNSTFSGGLYGIYMAPESSLTATNINVLNNVYGIYFNNSNNNNVINTASFSGNINDTITLLGPDGNHFTALTLTSASDSNDDGVIVLVNSTDNWISGSTFTTSATKLFNFSTYSVNNTLHTSYYDSAKEYVDGTSQLIRSWVFTGTVEDKAKTKLQGAKISFIATNPTNQVVNYSDGRQINYTTLSGSTLTNSPGIGIANVVQYINIFGAQYLSTPYDFTASYLVFTPATAQIAITDNTAYTFTLEQEIASTSLSRTAMWIILGIIFLIGLAASIGFFMVRMREGYSVVDIWKYFMILVIWLVLFTILFWVLAWFIMGSYYPQIPTV